MKTNQKTRENMIADFNEATKNISKEDQKEIDILFEILDEEVISLKSLREIIANKFKQIK